MRGKRKAKVKKNVAKSSKKNIKKSAEHLLKFKLNRGNAIQAAKFIIAIIAAFALLHTAFFLIVPLQIYESAIASIVAFIFGAFGVQASVNAGMEPVVALFPNGLQIFISYLCTGALETFLLIAAILASFGIDMRKRIIGAIAAFIAVFIFNLLRILITIFLLINLDLRIAEISHDLLFRISLLIAIAGFYYAWQNWAAGR
ncbi:MAG: hypothetical protein HYW05_04870 [Candidatus Diapherotrites archaeon]|nr:hypothetical protein [Candidatus Diapherotrites archaeon]